MKKLTMIKLYKKTSVIAGFSLFSIMISVDANADIYKCVNLKDEVYYNDKPCPVTEVERKMKAVKDPVGGYMAPTTFTKEKEIASRKFVVVGEDGNTVDSNNNLNPDSAKEGGGSQNLDSQTGGNNPTDSTIKDNSKTTSNKKELKFMNAAEVLMPTSEYKKSHNPNDTY